MLWGQGGKVFSNLVKIHYHGIETFQHWFESILYFLEFSKEIRQPCILLCGGRLLTIFAKHSFIILQPRSFRKIEFTRMFHAHKLERRVKEYVIFRSLMALTYSDQSRAANATNLQTPELSSRIR